MRLYTCIDELFGREYFRTGMIKVCPRDDKIGVIAFSPVGLLQSMPEDSIMLEFEVPNFSSFVPNLRPRESNRVMYVSLSNCERTDMGYVFRLESKFVLKAVYIAPDCQITWREVRLELKKGRNEGVGINILTTDVLAEGNDKMTTVIEQYWPCKRGLRCLKRSRERPSVYDESFISDVGR